MGAGEEIVVVPERGGPLVGLDAGTRTPDEIDELVDELFGPDDDDGGPSWFDAVLLVGGGAVFGVGLVAGMTGLVVGGVIMFVLGLMLPLRSLWRARERRREERRRTSILAEGVPLRVSDPELARLAHAYAALGERCVDRNDELARQSYHLGHAAVREVATLLHGAPVTSDAERAYVAKRIIALEGIARVLHERPVVPEIDPTLLVAAREQLDEVGGGSALTELEQLIQESRGRSGEQGG
jgi:hypothetical protein